MVIRDTEIILKTPFVIQKFRNIDIFMLDIFPDLKLYSKPANERNPKVRSGI